MSLLDKVKAGATQAAARAKEELDELQTKRELGQAYGDLGKKAFELVESGAVTHPELTPLVEKARALKAELEAAEAAGAPPAAGETPEA